MTGNSFNYVAYAFIMQSVALLSTIVRSQKAIDVNIAIMRVYVFVRQLLADHEYLKIEIREHEMSRKFKALLPGFT